MTVYLTACPNEPETIAIVKGFLEDTDHHTILTTIDGDIQGRIWDNVDPDHPRVIINDKVKDVIPPEGYVFILSED